jgi:uncharacterized protein (TIGR02444 family)
MSLPFPPNSLWDFSLALYAQPGVADACLQLQDEHGLNVNLLLWCVWLEQLDVHLTEAHFQEAHHHTDEWDRRYVVPLRQLRRRMKTEFGTRDETIEAIRNQIKGAELAAEKELQMRLQRLTYQWLQTRDYIAPVKIVPVLAKGEVVSGGFTGENLRRYLGQAGVKPGAIESTIQCVCGVLRNI